jgi:hypothetical protein
MRRGIGLQVHHVGVKDDPDQPGLQHVGALCGAESVMNLVESPQAGDDALGVEAKPAQRRERDLSGPVIELAQPERCVGTAVPGLERFPIHRPSAERHPVALGQIERIKQRAAPAPDARGTAEEP